MKWINVKNKDDKKESLPAWGAWIEIHPKTSQKYLDLRRSPHGEHGLSIHKKILKVCISKTRANVDLT